MEENLIGYLLNALDPLTQRQVEAYLADHADARARLELLRQALEPLAADAGLAEAPPPGLAERTLRHVAEANREFPQAPAAAQRSFGPPRTPWRRADVLVAALVLLGFVSTALPWVVQLRRIGRSDDNPVHRIECQENLRKFHEAMMVYHDRNGRFPNVDRITGPRKAAGLLVPYLIDQGCLPATVNVQCPAAGGNAATPWTLAQLQDMGREEFEHSARHLNPGYAYSLGYLENGKCLSVSLQDKPGYIKPLMADCPGPDATKGNSPNHGGKGQNVLYVDGSVKFCTTRAPDGDDFYVNKIKKVGTGFNQADDVLGGSDAAP